MLSLRHYIVVYCLLLATGLYIHLHADLTVPMNRPFSEFPLNLAGWQCVSQTTFDDSTLAVLRPADYLYRIYQRGDGVTANLYIGYHSGGKDSGPIHSPKHCLPGSGWYLVSSGQQPLEAGSGQQAVKSVYRKGESSELFLYWFQVRGKYLTNEYALKLAEISGSLFQRRRDTAFIRISVPYTGDERQALRTALEFAKQFRPSIDQFLPK